MDGRPSADLWLDSGISYIPLPAAVRSEKAVVNFKNKADNASDGHSVSALFPAYDHVDRPSMYPTNDDLNFKGIDAPRPSLRSPKWRS